MHPASCPAPLAAALTIATIALPCHAGRMIGSAEIGFDSYVERYTITDEDTLSSVNEARARIRLGYASGFLGRNYVLVEARQMVGESSYETAGRGLLTRRLGGANRWMLSLDAEAARRGFRAGTAYEFPNDYTRAAARGGLRVRAAPWLTLRVDDRIEWIDYDDRTEFDYDYTRNMITGAADLSGDPMKGVSVGTRFTTMSIPDSSEIEYQALTPFVEARAYGTTRQRVYGGVAAERRLYPGAGTRSSFWTILGYGLLEMPLHEQWTVEMATDIESYAYDTASDVYTDYFQCRNYVAVNWFTGALKAGAGPSFGWLSSTQAPQDVYREVGVRVAFEVLGARGLYLYASYEPGYRDYSAYNASADAIQNSDAVFSDYVYHRVGLFGNAHVGGPMWFTVFLNYEPEDHDRAGDDATATVASISLTYSY